MDVVVIICLSQACIAKSVLRLVIENINTDESLTVILPRWAPENREHLGPAIVYAVKI